MSDTAMHGRVALVTGAASGIGAAAVARLRADGATVATLYYDTNGNGQKYVGSQNNPFCKDYLHP